jgi:tRNA (guanine37-N1)-methyltransferase
LGADLVWFGIVTLFPEMFQALRSGITGKAISEQLISIDYWNPRDFATDKHKSVDDHPYGGGSGMLLMAGPLRAAICAAKEKAREAPTVVYLSPQGKCLNQKKLMEFIDKKSIVLVAGRYEGIDERIIQEEVDEELSIGDYVLTGGELPAMVLIDAITRLVPGAVSDPNSVLEDSITTGLLKYPQYTRPETFDGLSVPPVLLSGHHEQIEKWRLKKSLGQTWLKRPDLLTKKSLNQEETDLLSEFIKEFFSNNTKKPRKTP